MSLLTDVLQYGSGSHPTASEAGNFWATDILSDGVVGSTTNTSGVAPATGAFAINAQGTPDTTVAVTAGVAYVTGTPTSQNSQRFRVRNTVSTNITIAANASGSTRYDWIYISLSAANLANTNVAGDNAASFLTSRSTSNTTDNGTPPTYGLLLGIVTVANGFVTITNGNIVDCRIPALSATATVNGWTPANETWTYASATTITVPSDATLKYSVGDKIKLQQGGAVKYFTVTSLTSTVLTIAGTSTLTNAPIYQPFFSKANSPVGFVGIFGQALNIASIATNETTTSGTFGDLTTPGPSVTITVGASGSVLLHISTAGSTSAGSCIVAYSASGANTIAAADGNGGWVTSSAATDEKTYTKLLTGLTAGSTTFTLKYRTTAGTASFFRRTLIVIPV